MKPTEYHAQDSNRSKKPQGKRHVSKNFPPSASELLAIWSALDAHPQAELLRVVESRCDGQTSEGLLS